MLEEACTFPPNKPRSDGYVRFMRNGRNQYAHVWAWEQENGQVPSGLQLDHLCRVRSCWTVSHLEPVSPKENSHRAHSNFLKTHCPRGHAYDKTNTRWGETKYGLGRWCRACDNSRRSRGKPH